MAIVGICQHCKYYGVMDNHSCYQGRRHVADKINKLTTALKHIQALSREQVDRTDLDAYIKGTESLTGGGE